MNILHKVLALVVVLVVLFCVISVCCCVSISSSPADAYVPVGLCRIPSMGLRALLYVPETGNPLKNGGSLYITDMSLEDIKVDTIAYIQVNDRFFVAECIDCVKYVHIGDLYITLGKFTDTNGDIFIAGKGMICRFTVL